MKYIIFLILIVVNITVLSQEQEEKYIKILPLDENREIYYSDVVKTDSLNKDELFNLTKQWFVDAFKSANDVIQMEDKEYGILTGKGYFEQSFTLYLGKMFGSRTYNSNIYFTAKIQCKDGRYKYEFYNFKIKYTVPGAQNVPSQDIDMTLEEWFKNMTINARKKFKEERKANLLRFEEDIDKEVKVMINDINNAILNISKEEDW